MGGGGYEKEAAVPLGVSLCSRTRHITRPGYGGSTRLEGRAVAHVVADTRTVLDELGVDKAYVAGAAMMRSVTPEGIADAFGDLVDEVDRATAHGPFAGYLAALDHEAFRISHWGWLDDDITFTQPWGFDVADIESRVHVWQGAHDRMVPFAHGQWLAANLPDACPHLFPEHGHLSLVVEQFPRILDELLADQG